MMWKLIIIIQDLWTCIRQFTMYCWLSPMEGQQHGQYFMLHALLILIIFCVQWHCNLFVYFVCTLFPITGSTAAVARAILFLEGALRIPEERGPWPVSPSSLGYRARASALIYILLYFSIWFSFLFCGVDCFIVIFPLPSHLGGFPPTGTRGTHWYM